MTDTMQELKDQALSEIQQEVNSEGLCRSGAEDRVFEIADSNVPIYYADIADYLPEVGHDMPELAEGATTVYQLIQIAIMEENTTYTTGSEKQTSAHHASAY